jgi:phage shock protein C
MAKKETKTLERPKKGRKIAGVSVAFGNYFNIDPTIVRLIWVILLIPGGLPGILPYLICWIVIPSEK